jgi:hypothetical protein
MIKANPSLPSSGMTLVIVCSFWPFSECEIFHPLTVWMDLGQLYRSLKEGSGELENLVSSAPIDQAVLCFSPPVVPEGMKQYRRYLSESGITKHYDGGSDKNLSRWLGSLPQGPERSERMVTTMGNSKFPFRVLRGRQTDMGYLIAGFSRESFPPEVRTFPRVTFVADDEVYAIGNFPGNIQVGLINAALDAEDIAWVRGLLLRAGIPEQNIVLETRAEPQKWTDWLRREFNIPKEKSSHSADGISGDLALVVGCPPDALPELRLRSDICWWDESVSRDTSVLPLRATRVFLCQGVGRFARLEIREEAVRRGMQYAEVGSPEEIIGHFSSVPRRTFAAKRVILLGVNLSAIPDISGDPLYACYNVSDTQKLTTIPAEAKLVAMATRGIHPDTVLRMRQLSREIGARFIEIGGGTGELKHWLRRTDIREELDRADRSQKTDLTMADLLADEEALAWRRDGHVQDFEKAIEEQGREGDGMNENEDIAKPREKSPRTLKRGELVGFARKIIGKYYDPEKGKVDFDGLYAEIVAFVGYAYPRERIYPLAKTVVDELKEQGFSASSPEKAETVSPPLSLDPPRASNPPVEDHVQEPIAAPQEDSVMEILMCAEAKLREGLDLIARAKLRLAVDAARLGKLERACQTFTAVLSGEK